MIDDVLGWEWDSYDPYVIYLVFASCITQNSSISDCDQQGVYVGANAPEKIGGKIRGEVFCQGQGKSILSFRTSLKLFSPDVIFFT